MNLKRTLAITTESRARRARAENGSASITHLRWDRGKYKGQPANYVGRELQASADVIAIYPKLRVDAEGPYVALYCYVDETARRAKQVCQ